MRPSTGIGNLFVRLALILVLLAGIVWNVRAAIADQLASTNRPASLRVAMRLDTENPLYPAQLAWELQVADPGTAQVLFERAVRLNPYDASSWISLGLIDEKQGDLAQAEANLLRASAVDATWLPNWSLANFYFRHQRWDAFWSSARKAAQMAPDDATSLLRLAWYAAPSETEIQDRLGIQRPDVQHQFLLFLITQGDAAEVAAWGNHASAASASASVDDVLSACEWLMEQRRPDLALPLGMAWLLVIRSLFPPSAPVPVTPSPMAVSPCNRSLAVSTGV